MKHRSVCFLILLLTLPIAASSLSLEPLPVIVPDEDWRPLWQDVDEGLQKQLEGRLNKNKFWAFLLNNKTMAVGLVDITRPDSARLAHINGSTMMYAASLPKIAVLLAACQAFEDRTLEETPEILNDLNDMIRTSSNQAATRVIDRLGFEKIEKVLTDPRYKLFDPEQGGGLWVGKRYAQMGRRYPDPLKGLSHAATVDQVCRFYYFLATGRLINPQRSRQMLDILSNPGLHHKFVHTLEEVAPQARLYRKSGTWRNWHSDSVLVWDNQWRRYILVGMVEHPLGGKVLEDLVPAIEEVLGH